MLNVGYYALGSAAREMLGHYARGEMYTWLNQNDGELGWMRASHRGIQMMPSLHIGHAVKASLAQRKFEFRYNHSFDRVVAYCGDLGRQGKTWITPELSAAYADLHRNGFAYSCEAWLNDELVGGVFGVQIGGFVSIDSMFHRANNAGKTVYGHHMLNLQKRGFHFVDVNYASEHCKRFGAEWIPQWQFEKLMRPVLHARIAMLEDRPAPCMPWHLLARERGVQLMRSAGHRLTRYLVRTPEIAETPALARAA